MKYVWFVQDYNSMSIDKVFTTQKAARESAKEYGKGRFSTVDKGRIYYYFTHNDCNDPACIVEKVPVIHAKRK